MKLCILVMMVFAAAAVNRDSLNMKVNQLLHNRPLIRSYYKCATGQGYCTPDGHRFKDIIVEVLQNGCGSCDDYQRSNISKLVWYLLNYESMWWRKLVLKYDPHKKYASKYESVL